MDRREFIKASLMGLGAASVPLALGCTENGARGGREQNVLFISIDDLNDWTGCLGGHPDARTPNIDRLAGRGVLFTNAHCSAPLCNPSRSSLLTGVLPSTSGVYHNTGTFRGSPVLKSAVTLPEHFMAHGYHVVGGGKIFHDTCDPRSWRNYFPSMRYPVPGDPLPPKSSLPLNGIPGTAHFDWGPLPSETREEEMGDWKMAQWASEELGKKHLRPFFLGVGFTKPHLPWYVPRKYFEMFPPDVIELPAVSEDDLDDVPAVARRMALEDNDHRNVLKYGQWRNAVAAYLASISFLDAQVGRVLAALEQSRYAKNTIVVLWSDNGWHLGEKHHWRKFSLWEESTRVILAVSAPGVTSPGSVCPRSVSLIDIYPTMVELCGLGPVRKLEGQSLMPLLLDPKGPRERPALTTYGRGNHSLRSERWRYTRYAEGGEELYDHMKDPNEWNNLAGDPAYDGVRADLARWFPTVNA